MDETALPPSLDDLIRRRPTALFLDFDGTLVEIADKPDAIDVPRSLAANIRSLASGLENRVALVTGRSLEDLEQHLGLLEICRAGSHGAARKLSDGSWLGEEPAGLPESVSDALQEFAQSRGLSLESKPHGAALHFRGAEQHGPDALIFADRLAAEHGLVAKQGKCIVELVREGADMGGAVRAFLDIEPFAGARPVFIGDDITDEDGFSAAQAAGGFGILVGEPRETRARYRLPDVPTVHQWLGLHE